MNDSTIHRLITNILQQHGRTFAHELSIPIEDNTAPALFQLLCASILLSHHCRLDCGLRATRAVLEEGWTSPEALAQSSWDERAAALREARYPRHDSAAETLGRAADLLLDWYEGDLHRLREEARCDPITERLFLKKIPGVGEAGADIFFREIQIIWDEIFPFADRAVLDTARSAGLPPDPDALVRFTGREGFVRLAAGLVRIKALDAFDSISHDARS